MKKETLINTLKSFWLTDKQGEIFLFLYQYGKNPASLVAKGVWMERTNTYKALKKLVYKWLISEISIRGIKYFFVSDRKIFTHKFEQEQKNLKEKEEKIPFLENELLKLENEKVGNIPLMRFFQGKEEIKYFFEDMYNTIREKEYVMIKMFASNTLENKSWNKDTFIEYSWDFIEKLKEEKINIELYLWNGVMTLENIIKMYDIQEVSLLPASNSAIQSYIFWNFVYVAIFKNIPFWFKIESQEFAQMLHFLLKKIEVKDKE